MNFINPSTFSITKIQCNEIHYDTNVLQLIETTGQNSLENEEESTFSKTTYVFKILQYVPTKIIFVTYDSTRGEIEEVVNINESKCCMM